MSTKTALDYAIRIIESYELDCRHLIEYLEGNPSGQGFCQGEIYREALEDIERLRNEPGDTPA